MRSARFSNSRQQAACALLGFSLLSCVWSAPLLLDPLHRSPNPLTGATVGASGDGSIFAWLLTYVPWALAHGHNPFVSHLLEYPGGISTMWNAGLSLVAVLLGPLTLWLGPIATINVLVIAAPASSAFTSWLWFRRHAGALPAVAGALVFGFGPVMAATNFSHYQLSILTLVPLICLAVEDLLCPHGRRTLRTGLRLGILIACQLAIGEEVLLITAVAIAVFLAIWLLSGLVGDRAELVPTVRRLATGGSAALGVALLLTAVPLYEQFGTHYALHRPIQATDRYAARPAHLVAATPRLWLSGHVAPGTNLSEQMGYLGLPLLVILVAGAVLVRRRLYLTVFLTLAVLEVLSFGRFRVIGKQGSGQLPWALLGHRGPFLNLLPIRFALLAALAAGFLLALALAWTLRRWPGRLGRLVAATLAVAALAPLVPHGWPNALAPARPNCLRGPGLAALRSSEATLLLPYPGGQDVRAQIWAAEAHFPFPMVGGYMVHPDQHGPFLDGTIGPVRTVFEALDHGPAPIPAGLAQQALAELDRSDVDRVVVTPTPAAGRERAFLTGLLAQPGRPLTDCTIFTLDGHR